MEIAMFSLKNQEFVFTKYIQSMVILCLCFTLFGCMDPSYYEDPEEEADVSEVDSIQSATLDDAAAASSVDVDEANADVSPDVTGPSDADGATEGNDNCVCIFDLPATSPLPQTFVWLTGDLVMPPWSMDISESALEMSLSVASGNWEIEVELSDGQMVNYKYLVGWADNPGPVWGNEDEDYSPDAENSALLVVCGETPCDVE